MTAGLRMATAAARHIGTRFRLHGRDPANGLDCVGLVYTSLREIGGHPQPPQTYRLRNKPDHRWPDFAARSGLETVSGEVMIGDVLMVEPGPAQQHLLIAETPHQFIHAHAGLRRVVRQRFDENLSVIAHWRLSAEEKEF